MVIRFSAHDVDRERFSPDTFLQFFSVDDAPLRSVLWSHDSRVVIFPPFESYPEISTKGFTDLRAYVAAGNNVVFMGSYIALQVRCNGFSCIAHSWHRCFLSKYAWISLLPSLTAVCLTFFPSQVMNDAFGFSLRDDYKEGPYYRFLIRFSAYVSAAKINLASSGTTETCAGRNSSTCPLV